ncbi:MAG: HAMP domain-containing histidine kinase [Bacteroidetes bacterium]|nr:HAMP domain-containing histidine kinase [Bacteroidota bacterium]
MLFEFQPSSQIKYNEEDIVKSKEELLYEVYELRKEIKNQEKVKQDFIRKEIQLKKYLDELELNQIFPEKSDEEFSAVYSKLKESENKLKNLNQNKDKFFSIIAHDLRSPFTALLGFSEYLAKYAKECTHDEIEDYSLQMHKSAKSLFALLENLLQWSRLQSGKIEFEKEPLSLEKISKRIFELFNDLAQNKDIKIINKIDNTITINTDANILEAILRNLISNAIKFTKPGGEIQLYSTIYKNHIEFIVKDNGIGMSEEEVEKLFRIDVQHSTLGTNKEKGTGLGLVICKEFIEKGLGTIKVTSKLGKGSEFRFTLPLS